MYYRQAYSLFTVMSATKATFWNVYVIHTVRRACDRGDEYVISDTHFRYPKGKDDCGRDLPNSSASSNEKFHVTVRHVDSLGWSLTISVNLSRRTAFRLLGFYSPRPGVFNSKRFDKVHYVFQVGNAMLRLRAHFFQSDHKGFILLIFVAICKKFLVMYSIFVYLSHVKS